MMKQSISEFLNDIKIEKIDDLHIDHENNKVIIKLSDYKHKVHELELAGVDNYHFIDDYIYVKENQDNNSRGVSFYDSSPWGYKTVSYDRDGNIVGEDEIEPNFVVNSKEKSICLRIKTAKLDGDFYPVFKSSFLAGNGTDISEEIPEC